MPTVIDEVVDRVDQIQRRHRFLAFPHAVFKRYGEDNGGWIGALISYYGFFSLFPLLVVFVTIATWVLGDRPDLLHSVLEAIWSRVPFAASSLQTNVDQEVAKLEGNGWIMVVSLLVTVWGGIGVVRVLQDGVNTVWGVARFRRPGFFPKIARGLAILGLIGVGLIGSGVVAGLTVTVQFPTASLVLVAIVNIVVASAIALVVYHLSIAEPVSSRDLAPGSIMVGMGAYGLTLVAGIYVQRVIARLTGVYGPFATTIGLLAYVSLAVQLFVFATEVNVVRARKLWPRSLSGRALGEPDAQALRLTLRRERLLSRQQLTERGLTPAEAAAVVGTGDGSTSSTSGGSGD
ncbi:MAG TPA: YihY/virulence factor BrkB family protein [Acidimicrobiales bacterium]|nr:YihY/virulence factor BrkB family protein [Acidimicrobiales bacterium]